MLIHWPASSQWLVPMSSPLSGREALSLTGERRLPGTSLEACGTRALIEAVSRSFFDAMHIEECGTRIGPLSATFGVSLHYKFCASFSGDVALTIEPQQPFTEGLGR